MLVKVMNDYTFFKGNQHYTNGAVIEVTEEEYNSQSWKVEVVKPERVKGKQVGRPPRDKMVRNEGVLNK